MDDDMTVTRHGVFVSRQTVDSQELFVKLKRLLLEKSHSVLCDEDRDILNNIIGEISKNNVSNAVMDSPFKESWISHQELHWLDTHDSTKWVEYLFYRYKFKVYPYTKKLTSFPPHLLIEPTSVCNLRCVMCFQVDETFTISKNMGMMNWDLFTSVVDQARDNKCQAITLASRGEPTLHKQFGEMLRYLSDAGIMDIKINTNATKLSEKLCHDILSSDTSLVVFSVDAATKDLYEKIRVKGNFEQVVNNIERFHEIREKYYSKSPTRTRISGVKINDQQNLVEIAKFWESLVDQVSIKKSQPRWDCYENDPSGIVDPCTVLWERMYVWYDGVVNPCDFDYKSYLATGNARESRLSDIWTGEKYTQLRTLHNNRKRHCIKPCDRCPIS